ncbi:hypothetical protein ACHAXH_000241 [Discostella pseudostelligera]
MLHIHKFLLSSCLLSIISIFIFGGVSAFVCSSASTSTSSSRSVHFTHRASGGEDNIIMSSSTQSANLSLYIQNMNNGRLLNNHYHLTILLPAYNERDRIGNTLSTYMNYLSSTPVYQHQRQRLNNYNTSCTNLVSGTVSILVVDDGSSDGTAEFIRDRSWLSEKEQAVPTAKDGNTNENENNYWTVDPKVNVITLEQNSGKGAAIERGMIELPSSFDQGSSCISKSVKSLVLVADADGSGDISCIDGMLHCLEEMLSNYSMSSTKWTDQNIGQTPALVVGYRQNLVPKSPLRAILSEGFRSTVSLLFSGQDLGVRDTQCGFKLMTVSAGKVLYNQLNLRQWTQDVEVIYRARLLNIPTAECGIVWVDKDGSKLITKKTDALFVSFAMFGEIANMRLQYTLGTWTATP